jgi:hypothetical protein
MYHFDHRLSIRLRQVGWQDAARQSGPRTRPNILRPSIQAPIPISDIIKFPVIDLDLMVIKYVQQILKDGAAIEKTTLSFFYDHF